MSTNWKPEDHPTLLFFLPGYFNPAHPEGVPFFHLWKKPIPKIPTTTDIDFGVIETGSKRFETTVYERLKSAGYALERRQCLVNFQRSSKFPRPTISQVLSRLIQFKKVERIGLGRSTRYREK